MRDGTKAAFDGDQILKIEKNEDYRENKVYSNKNRYNDAPKLKYIIYSGALEGGAEQPENTEMESKAKLIAIPVI